MVVLALNRAGWLDEYWTVWHSDPAVPFGTAYATRWLQDTAHPPTYYAWAWTMGHLTGPTLAARRLVDNGFVLMLLAGGTALACRRRGSHDSQLALFALLMLGQPFAIIYFAEHRSYFVSLVAAACLLATLRQLHRESLGGRPRRYLLMWFVALTVVALNIHYTETICLLAVLGCATLFHWYGGRRATGWLIAGAAALGLVPLAVTAAIAFRLHPIPVVIAIGLLRGWATIGAMLLVGGLANPVLLAIAARNVPALRPDPAARSFILILIAALLLLCLSFAALHAHSHNLVPRLLLGLIPPTSALVAELAARRPLGRGALGLAWLFSALVAVGATLHELRNPRWEYAASTIAASVLACPKTRVLALDPLILLPPTDPGWHMTGQPQAMALSYHLIARRYGFQVHVVPEDGAPPALSRDCPTLIWLEHNFFRSAVTPEEVARLAGAPMPLGSLATTRDGPHMLVRIAPPRP